MRDYILLSIFKKFLFLIIFIIFSDMLNIESLSAKSRMNTGKYCYNCKHPSRCSMCFHTYPTKNNSYTDKNEDLKDSNSKKSSGISNIILDGISFGNRQSAENNDEDTENQDESTMNRDTNIDDEDGGNNEDELEGDDENGGNNEDELEGDNENGGNNEDELEGDNEDGSNNEDELEGDNEDGSNNEDELEGDNEDGGNNEEGADDLNNARENGTDTNIGSGYNMMLPDSTTDVQMQAQNGIPTDLYGAQPAGGDNYQEIVQDVIEYFRELGVLDDNKLSQLSQGLKNGICMACKNNGLVHIIPGKKTYNICSNCFERMIDGFIGNGSGHSTATNLSGNNSGVMSVNNSGGTGVYNNGQTMGSNMPGQNMNGDMSGQNNATANAASGIVDAALSSIPGMNGKLESALSNGISSMLHKNSGDSGVNPGSGYATPITGPDGLPVTTNMPSNQNAVTTTAATAPAATAPAATAPAATAPAATAPAATAPAATAPAATAPAAQPPVAASGEKMVLNAIGQLVPISSLAGTSAPYGYKQNPDGTFSVAMSDAPVTPTENTPKNTPANSLGNTLSNVGSSINSVVSTASTIANAAAPITGLISGLITNAASSAANNPTAAADKAEARAAKKAAAADKKAAAADARAAKKAATADKKAAAADARAAKKAAAADKKAAKKAAAADKKAAAAADKQLKKRGGADTTSQQAEKTKKTSKKRMKKRR